MEPAAPLRNSCRFMRIYGVPGPRGRPSNRRAMLLRRCRNDRRAEMASLTGISAVSCRLAGGSQRLPVERSAGRGDLARAGFHDPLIAALPDGKRPRAGEYAGSRERHRGRGLGRSSRAGRRVSEQHQGTVRPRHDQRWTRRRCTSLGKCADRRQADRLRRSEHVNPRALPLGIRLAPLTELNA